MGEFNSDYELAYYWSNCQVASINSTVKES